MTQRIAVFPADRHSLYEEHGYSAAIRSGDLLFVSGQVGSHTDGTPEPDFQKQVRIHHYRCTDLRRWRYRAYFSHRTGASRGLISPD